MLAITVDRETRAARRADTPARSSPIASVPAHHSTAPARAAPDALGARLARAVLQRKRTYVNYEGNHVEVITRAMRAIEIREKVARPLTETELVYGLTGLTVSPIDYGTIDLGDDQHLMLLYHHIVKQAMPLRSEDDRTVTRKGGRVEQEKERIETQEHEVLHPALGSEEAEWRRMVERAPKGSPPVRVAFLGAGASIAYYIATMSRNLDPREMVVIGTEQPWRTDRGPGVLGHAEHMVTPMLDFVGDRTPASTWLERGSFSDLIDAVFARSGIRRIRRAVTGVSRETPTSGAYSIAVEGQDRPTLAQKVVSGIGVGRHTMPKNDKIVARTPGEIGADKRVIDMDLFTRVAEDLVKDGGIVTATSREPPNPEEIAVIVSGPNAGIDAAFEALRCGYRVHWIVGSTGPKLLPGFFNYAVYLPYLRAAPLDKLGLRDERERGEKLVAVRRELDELYRDQASRLRGIPAQFEDVRFAGVYFGRAADPVVASGKVTALVDGRTTVEGDIYVNAIGQDSTEPLKVLKGVEQGLVPLRDTSGRFSDDQTTTLGLASPDRSYEIIGASAYRFALNVAPDRELVHAVSNSLYDGYKAVRGAGVADPGPFGRASDAYFAVWRTFWLDEPVNADPQKLALQAFDEQYKKYEAARRSIAPTAGAQADAVAAFDRIMATARATTAQGSMKAVISSLPGNVMFNDQLTPSRSQIIASTGFVPYDTGRHVDFTNADRTVLATHISARYPRLADSAAIGPLVQSIVDSRTQTVAGGPTVRAIPPHVEAFQRFWSDRLAILERAG